MKKFSVALAAAGLAASLGAYAAVPTDAQPFQLVVPNLKSGIEITLEGLLLRPTNNDQQYAATNTFTSAFSPVSPFITTENDKTLSQANPKYNFGFRVGLGYIFPDSGNDVQLNWVHFNKSQDTSTSAEAGQTLVTDFGVPLINFNPALVVSTPGIIFDPLTAVVTNTFDPTASSTSNFKYDQVNLDVGQYLDVGTRLRLRMFGGLSYARVQDDLSNSYAAGYNAVVTDDETSAVLVNNTVGYAETDDYDSKFTGIGPRFGIDSSYHISNCFGLVAHVAGALYVGKVDSSTDQDFLITSQDNLAIPTTVDTVLDSDLTTTTDNQWRVVPAFDAKLGLDYTYIAANQSMFSIEAGYQWTQYIDAVDRLHNTLQDGIGFTTVTKTTSSVGFDGPYLTLNYKM